MSATIDIQVHQSSARFHCDSAPQGQRVQGEEHSSSINICIDGKDTGTMTQSTPQTQRMKRRQRKKMNRQRRFQKEATELVSRQLSALHIGSDSANTPEAVQSILTKALKIAMEASNAARHDMRVGKQRGGHKGKGKKKTKSSKAGLSNNEVQELALMIEDAGCHSTSGDIDMDKKSNEKSDTNGDVHTHEERNDNTDDKLALVLSGVGGLSLGA